MAFFNFLFNLLNFDSCKVTFLARALISFFSFLILIDITYSLGLETTGLCFLIKLRINFLSSRAALVSSSSQSETNSFRSLLLIRINNWLSFFPALSFLPSSMMVSFEIRQSKAIKCIYIICIKNPAVKHLACHGFYTIAKLTSW